MPSSPPIPNLDLYSTAMELLRRIVNQNGHVYEHPSALTLRGMVTLSTEEKFLVEVLAIPRLTDGG